MKPSFWDIFQNMDGSFSSRRVFGALLLVGGFVAMLLKYDLTTCKMVMGGGAALLGLTTLDPHPPAPKE
jgi:hypothetical protein